MGQLSRNIGSTYLARAAAIVAAILLFPFIAAQVGLADYGIFLLFASIAFFFTADFGMGTAAVRYVAEAHSRGDAEDLSRVTSSILAFFAVLGIAMAAAFAGSMALVLPSLEIPQGKTDLALAVMGIVAVGRLALALPLSVFKNVLAGIHRYDVANLFMLIQTLLRAAMIVGFLLSGLSVLLVAVADAVAAVLAGLLAMRACRRLLPDLRISPTLVSVSALRSMAPYSLQVFVMGLAALVIMHADNLIIGLILPVASVTLYTAAFRIYQVCREVTGSVLTPLVTAASRAQARGDRERLRELLLNGTKYANALLLVLAVPAMIFAEPLLVLWAGEPFAEAALAAQVLLAGLLVNNHHLVAVPLMMGVGRVGAYARYHALWALSNIALSVVLIHELGLVGAALGTAVPIALLEPLYVRTVLRELGLGVRRFVGAAVARTLGPALAATAPVLLLALTWDPRSLAGVVAASALYACLFGAAFAAVGLGPGERARVRRSLRAGLSAAAPATAASPEGERFPRRAADGTAAD